MTYFLSDRNPNAIYLYDRYGTIETLYKPNDIGFLKQCKFVPLDSLKPVTSIHPDMKLHLASLAILHREYENSIKLVGKRIGWTLPKDNTDIAIAFTAWLREIKCEEMKELDLRDLGIKELPPQISRLFKSLENLNLANNNLLLLPPELQLLPLKALDISGNKRLQPNIPRWIGVKGIELTAERINLMVLPEGLSSLQIKCENKLYPTSDAYGVFELDDDIPQGANSEACSEEADI